MIFKNYRLFFLLINSIVHFYMSKQSYMTNQLNSIWCSIIVAQRNASMYVYNVLSYFYISPENSEDSTVWNEVLYL